MEAGRHHRKMVRGVMKKAVIEVRLVDEAQTKEHHGLVQGD